MMKIVCRLCFIVSVLLFSCTDKHDKAQDDYERIAAGIPPIPFTVYKASDDAEVNKTYLPTGFYYFTNNDGVKLMRQRSDEVYNLNRYPFVSVNDIVNVSIEKQPTGEDTITSIKMVLSQSGARALAEGTGNSRYPYLAIVMAGKLFYVVKNVQSITGGAMSVVVTGYTNNQLNELTAAIRHKQ